MAKYNYSTQVKENMAKAVLRSAPISTKHCIEICNMLRKKNVEDAKKILTQVINFEKAVPFKRFNGDVGHKPGIGPGRYPIKASQMILDLLGSIEANAQFKGLSTANLQIVHISAQKSSRPLRYGRQRGRLSKRTNIELVVEEKAAKREEKKPVEKKTEKPVEVKPKVEEKKKEEPKVKETPKVEPKVEEKKEEVKPEIKTTPKAEVKEEPKPVVEKKEEPKQEEKPKVEVKETPKPVVVEKKETPKVEEKPVEKKEEPKSESQVTEAKK